MWHYGVSWASRVAKEIAHPTCSATHAQELPAGPVTYLIGTAEVLVNSGAVEFEYTSGT